MKKTINFEEVANIVWQPEFPEPVREFFIQLSTRNPRFAVLSKHTFNEVFNQQIDLPLAKRLVQYAAIEDNFYEAFYNKLHELRRPVAMQILDTDQDFLADSNNFVTFVNQWFTDEAASWLKGYIEAKVTG